MAKAKKSLKGLGARYGIKIRKQYTKIHLRLKEKRSCPECGSKTFGRDAVGERRGRVAFGLPANWRAEP